MAQFCFAEQKRELFTEAFLRGWWQACVDFPRKADSALVQTMQGVLDELRAHVCCIDNEFAYGTLVLSAWGAGYNAGADNTPRVSFVAASALKSMSKDEGMALIRRGMSSRDGVALMEQAYAQLVAFMPLFK